MQRLHKVFIFFGLFSLVLLAISGPLYKNGMAELGTAFMLLRWAAYIGIATLVINILWLLIRRPKGGTALLTGLAIIAGGIAFYTPYSQMKVARSVPVIHDITTDTEHPPAFIAIAPLRASAPNPVEYAGAESAQKQLEAYPDLMTFRSSHTTAQLFDSALMAAKNMGWELVDESKSEGRIEATDTTRWFGFKDDVVIRIRATDNGSELDIRSKSRVGRSDVGKNAERIREYILQLELSLT